MKPKKLKLFAPILNLFLVLVFTKGNHNNEILKKVSIFIIFSYILLFIQMLFSFENLNISYLDGILKKNETTTTLSLVILIIGLLILLVQTYQSETYIIFLTNLLGIIFLLHSNDWILTIISWEIFNMSLYLLVSLRSENEAGLAASLKYFLLSA